MQLLEHWDPLNLPRGTVRALITLSILGLLWGLLLRGREVPLTLAFLSLFLLGHYFAARSGAPPGRRQPLFLPRGSIRLLIIAGFALVAYFLIEDGRLRLSVESRESAIILIAGALMAGFLFRKLLDLPSAMQKGVFTRGVITRPRRWIENVKAVLALMATAAFIIGGATGYEGHENVALAAVALIVFYFGSRQGWPGGRESAPPPAV